MKIATTCVILIIVLLTADRSLPNENVNANSTKDNTSTEDASQIFLTTSEPGDMRSFDQQALKVHTNVWNLGKIPYDVSRNFSTEQKVVILTAMAEIERKTCIKFYAKWTETNFIFINPVGPNHECSSSFGQIGQRQFVNLTIICANNTVAVLRQLVQTIGLYPENNRFDRDEHVVIHEENIDPRFLSKFQKIQQAELINFNIPYDHESVTHFFERNYSRDGEKTISLKTNWGIIKPTGLSEQDILKINLLYNCTELLPDDKALDLHYNVRKQNATATEASESDGNFLFNNLNSSSSSTWLNTNIVPLVSTSTERPISNLSLEEKNLQLFLAAENGDSVTLVLLLDEGADVNARDKDDHEGVLHCAARLGHVNVARLLLDRFADVEAKDKIGQRPLHVAAFYGHANLAAVLLDYDADIESRTPNKLTPLHFASQRGHANLVSFLLSSARIESKDENGLTALHYVSRYGFLNAVQVLLNHSANVDARDNNNFSPLHYASSFGHKAVVLILIEYGANIFAKGTFKKDPDWRAPYATPLYLAETNNHEEIVDILESKQKEISPITI